MIALEVTKEHSVVRIHDEFCQISDERQIAAIGQIVSDSYKRRYPLEEVAKKF